ncbi:hypothetical protein C7S18_16705 [Ahniella affigens]|uniref:DUF2785 domain-containing protein n=1 Tax=Ahniella affigens TaxID=2021234 RepID=A0A2P1PV48_9GAMM|nr:DUF2785 domain-containing protein [Ahniella affigens]AVP98727.1 hypothetical protein C7S18_16705 [Ahniella affigens]
MLIRLSALNALLCAAWCCAGAASAAACPPADWDKARLLTLRANQFAVSDPAERVRLGDALLACLKDPDPVLRDQVAYEAYATWLRSGVFADEHVARWTVQLLDDLADTTPDPAGVRRPFAALVLSELARTDRIKPHFEPALRQRLVADATAYLRQCRDYRGFSESIGWRHGVAHAADWVMQLGLNDRVKAPALRGFQDALLGQVGAHGQYAYIDGESERLARAVLMLMHRNELTADSWVTALAQFDHPETVPNWSDVFGSRTGLNERHNLRQFLYELDEGVRASQLPAKQAYVDVIARLLKATAV